MSLMCTTSQTPDERCLRAGLGAMFTAAGADAERLTIVKRSTSNASSSFPCEILELQLGERRLAVFCKYEAGYSHDGFGHRGGLALEAAVHRDLLAEGQLTTPRFYGSYVEPDTGQTWLVMQYLADAVPLNEACEPEALVRAAQWLAGFHQFGAQRLDERSVPELRRYDAEYYRGWASRTVQFAAPLRTEYPWLHDVERRSERWAEPLLKAPQTIVHGEFYPKNILVSGREIYPVDWESAAIAAGEIDLASLTENWPQRDACESVCAYRQQRGPLAGSDLVLCASRIYLHLRWLGNRPHRTCSAKLRWRFNALKGEAERFGII